MKDVLLSGESLKIVACVSLYRYGTVHIRSLCRSVYINEYNTPYVYDILYAYKQKSRSSLSFFRSLKTRRIDNGINAGGEEKRMRRSEPKISNIIFDESKKG